MKKEIYMKEKGYLRKIDINKALEFLKDEDRSRDSWKWAYDNASRIISILREDVTEMCPDKDNLLEASHRNYVGEDLLEKLEKQMIYAEEYEQPVFYHYVDETAVIIQIQEKYLLLPAEYVQVEPFKDYSDTPLKLLAAGNEISRMLPDIPDSENITENSMRGKLEEKKNQIQKAMGDIVAKRKEKEAEIEEMKRQIEERYTSALNALDEKMGLLEEQKQILENEIFILDTEIYGIRCFFGETVSFTKLTSGKNAAEEEPVVLYQKIRFLDEELAKYVAVYNIEEHETEGIFEEMIKNRTDLRELFFPGNKSISLIRLSRDGKVYYSSQAYSSDNNGNTFCYNIMNEYKILHGNKTAILIRNGENCYIGWTDAERINIPDGNAFLSPKKMTVSEVEEEENWKREKEIKTQSSSKTEVVSRYFIFSILQGIVLHSKLIQMPDGTDIIHDTGKYVIYSMADNWLTDNTYGTLEDILALSENILYRKGDSVLTLRNLRAEGKWETYNNDRGRGYMNRTHDVAASDNTIYSINLVENSPAKKFSWKYRRKQKSLSANEKSEWKKQETFQYDSLEEFWKYHDTVEYEYQNVKITDTFKQEIFISLEKEKNWYTGAQSRANFELYKHEFINLTFLDSVRLRYVIINRKIGKEKFRGYNFSSLISYLNHALEYILKREKEEEGFIKKYVDVLPDNWQVKLTDWKITNDVHKITDYQAKRFAKTL